MITDQSGMLHGISIARLSKYLSLCKIDCLVRKAEVSAPSHRVDQPSKVGQVGTITVPSHAVQHSYALKISNDLKIGNKNRTLYIKKVLNHQLKLKIESLSEAGTVILQQDNMDIGQFSIFRIVSYADFALKQRKEWKFCLVCNKQENWVKTFLALAGRSRLQVDYLMVINQGCIWYFQIPKSKGDD